MLGSVILALLMSWPLAAHLDSHLPAIGLGDPLLQAWQVAWGGHALTRQPLAFFQSNTFWPLRDSLAFSDALLGYAPAGLVGSGVTAAVWRYNLLYIFAYALAFAGTFALARQLGVSIVGAAVAGASFAYAPWRLDQSTHLHVISSGGVPLALFLLLRGHQTARPWTVLAGWCVATWQLSIGFTLGLQFAYLLAVLYAVGLACWIWARRPALSRAVVGANAVGMLAFLLWAGLQAQPYLRVVQEHDEARRTVQEATFYSPPLRGLIAAPANSLLWGDLTQSIRTSLVWPTEQAIFPGIVSLTLAAVGLTARSQPWPLRGALALTTVLAVFLSLGFAGPGGDYLYGALYAFAPGWQGIRTPGRITMVTSLSLALLAAIGAHWLLLLARRRLTRPGLVALALPCVGALLVGGVLIDGYGLVQLTRVPPAPQAQLGVAGPRLHLPSDSYHDLLYMLWSTEDFQPVVNGHSGFTPRALRRLRTATRSFPRGDSHALLRSLGVRTVLVHDDLKVQMQGAGDGDPAKRRLAVRWTPQDAIREFTIDP